MELTYPENLPISGAREQIVAAIRTHQVLVVAGDTGSGKTTQLPKMCLEAGRGLNGRIGCTQPRRIAAVSVSERVAEELGEPDIAAYQIRFHDGTTEATRIKFMTDGVLLAETRKDRDLRQYDTLIIDEAHERSLNIDFLLGYLKQLLTRRPDLKLIISSATIDTERFSGHFDQAPIIDVEGRLYPIEYQYRDLREGEEESGYVEAAVEEALALLAHPGGDILIFMPTEQDIRETIDSLAGQTRDQLLLLPLYGRLPAQDQRRIFRPSPKRKVIVATNVAETSITVPGIRFVIDTGLARISRYNVRARTTNLQISRISQASCNQRAGRCGRTGPGVCVRLYGADDYAARPEFTLPEIQRSNLAEVILRMLDLDLGDPLQFPFIDQPLPRAVHDGFRLLTELGALDQDRHLSRAGKLMAHLPLDPTIAKILLEGANQGATREIMVIAAALSIQDPRVRPPEAEGKADEAHRRFRDERSDFLSLLNIWDQLHAGGQRLGSAVLGRFCKNHYLSWQRMREWLDVHGQLQQLLKKHKSFALNSDPASYEAIHIALTSGFLRNIAQRKEKNSYQAGGGREVRLFPGSALYNRGGQWLVASAFVETSQLFARTAARIDPAWLEPLAGELCARSWSDPHWEKRQGQVVANERVSLFGLVIVPNRKVNFGRLNDQCREEARDIFIQDGLLTGQLNGNYPFLEHNLALVKRLHDLEERVRRRSVLVDEHVLHAFYRKRLPGVYDRFTLNRLLKRRRSDAFLRMTAEDICLQAPDDDELYRFPASLRSGSLELSLSYRFEPGSEEDGVTARIPQALADQINPNVFEWLVPGLLPEKILLLLKRLPKKLRRHLVPLPETVDLVMDSLELYKGSLYTALERSLLRLTNLVVQRGDWQVETLPQYLRMRFVLVDDQERPLLSGRSFRELQHQAKAQVQARPQPGATGPLPSRNNITDWDFADLPASIQVKDRQGRSTALCFPTLVIDEGKGCLNLHYIPDEQESIAANRRGLEFLYGLQCATQLTRLRKQCRQVVNQYSASWLSLGLKMSGGELAKLLLDFVLTPVLETADGTLPDQDTFQRVRQRIATDGLLRQTTPYLEQVIEALKRRRETLSHINVWVDRARRSRSYDQGRHQEYLASLEQILPADFIARMGPEELVHTARQLQALRLRIERAEHDPTKDRQKAARLTPHLARLEQLAAYPGHGQECRRVKREFRQMIEEFRVSVFAPELGTATTVSEKRLTKKWQEVESFCRPIE
jgi:ATP-dependent helicase HrpA